MKGLSWRHREVCLEEPMVGSHLLQLSLHRGHVCPRALSPSHPSFALKGREHSPQFLQCLCQMLPIPAPSGHLLTRYPEEAEKGRTLPTGARARALAAGFRLGGQRLPGWNMRCGGQECGLPSQAAWVYIPCALTSCVTLGKLPNPNFFF